MPFSFYDALMGISETLKRERERETPLFLLLFSPIPSSHPAAWQMVAYPAQKLATGRLLSQSCFSAASEPRAGFKLPTATCQSPGLWAGRLGRLIACLTAELFPSTRCQLSLSLCVCGECFAETKVEFFSILSSLSFFPPPSPRVQSLIPLIY